MYRIIGADKKEYGPITADQIRQWIAEGRVNGQTMAQAEGSAEWKPLASFPEFVPALGAPPSAPAGAQPAPILPQVPLAPAALAQVQGPAIALMVVAVLNFICSAIGLVSNLLGKGMGRFGPIGNPEIERLVEMSSGIAGIVSNLLGLGLAALIFMGAQKMKNLQSHGFAMTAAIVAMIPCLSPCCLIGLPIGIWALVVLSKPEVKAAFQ